MYRSANKTSTGTPIASAITFSSRSLGMNIVAYIASRVTPAVRATSANEVFFSRNWKWTQARRSYGLEGMSNFVFAFVIEREEDKNVLWSIPK
jgi:ABC-type phosphate transport system permease subunit